MENDDSRVTFLINEDNTHALMDCTLTPVMQKNFAEVFGMELDLLQATKLPLPDGRTRFQFELRDPLKIAYMVTLVNRANLLTDAIARSN